MELINCYADRWSCLAICVGCNCCGRYKKELEMWTARLDYHKELLNENKNFKDWFFGDENLLEIQKKVTAENIDYHEKKIKYCELKINKLTK